jgi:hypothetical protein
MPTYEILHVGDDVREWTAKQGPAAGQTFKSYTVRAKCPDGTLAGGLPGQAEARP